MPHAAAAAAAGEGRALILSNIKAAVRGIWGGKTGCFVFIVKTKHLLDAKQAGKQLPASIRRAEPLVGAVGTCRASSGGKQPQPQRTLDFSPLVVEMLEFDVVFTPFYIKEKVESVVEVKKSSVTSNTYSIYQSHNILSQCLDHVHAEHLLNSKGKYGMGCCTTAKLDWINTSPLRASRGLWSSGLA